MNLTGVRPKPPLIHTFTHMKSFCLENAYFGSNYAKLLAIKKKYDPNSVLDCFRCGEYLVIHVDCTNTYQSFSSWLEGCL